MDIHVSHSPNINIAKDVHCCDNLHHMPIGSRPNYNEANIWKGIHSPQLVD